MAYTEATDSLTHRIVLGVKWLTVQFGVYNTSQSFWWCVVEYVLWAQIADIKGQYQLQCTE